MTHQEYFAAVEAVLFANGEPVSTERLAQVLELSEKETRDLMKELIAEYQSKKRGIQVISLEDSYQLCTKPQYGIYIKKAMEIRRTTPLSQAALETLAIVAYNQPVTKSFVEQVRGVDSSSIMNSLSEKGLIEEAGRLEIPGRPIAYQTTANFLRSFQMETLEELPPLPEESGLLPDESGQVQMKDVIQS